MEKMNHVLTTKATHILRFRMILLSYFAKILLKSAVFLTKIYLFLQKVFKNKSEYFENIFAKFRYICFETFTIVSGNLCHKEKSKKRKKKKRKKILTLLPSTRITVVIFSITYTSFIQQNMYLKRQFNCNKGMQTRQ